MEISSFDISKVGDMSYMFGYCLSLTEISFSNYNSHFMITMDKMFYGCEALKIINCSEEFKELLKIKFPNLSF